MRYDERMLIIFTILLFLFSCANTEVVKQTESKQVIAVPANTESKTIQFKKIVVQLNKGEEIGSIQAGWLCVPHANIKSISGNVNANVSNYDYSQVFKEDLTKANYNVVGDPNALFEDESDWKAVYLIAGIITEVKFNICYPWGSVGNWTTGKGDGYMKVNWQIYSRLNKKVVYETTTEGSSKIDHSSPTGPSDVFLNAFSMAVENLLADKGFHDLLVTTNQPIPMKR